MKKIIASILSLVLLFTVSITAYANDIELYSNNVYTTDVSFSIASNGKATASYEYRGKSGVTKNAKIVTKIQKKVGIIWVTVSGASWTDMPSDYGNIAITFTYDHNVNNWYFYRLV